MYAILRVTNQHSLTSLARFLSGPGTLEPRRSGWPPATRFRLRAAPLCAALSGLELCRRPQPAPLATPRGGPRAVLSVADDDAPQFRVHPDVRGRSRGPHRSFVQRHCGHHAHVLCTTGDRGFFRHDRLLTIREFNCRRPNFT